MIVGKLFNIFFKSIYFNILNYLGPFKRICYEKGIKGFCGLFWDHFGGCIVMEGVIGFYRLFWDHFGGCTVEGIFWA